MNKSPLCSILLFALSTLPATCQVILIDQTTRNGSFESGLADPWGGISASPSTSFAQSGSWYGTVQGSRATVYQFLTIAPSKGLEFDFSFWARVPSSNGFASLAASLVESPIAQPAMVTPLLTPDLSSLEWRKFAYHFTIPEDWIEGPENRITITFPYSVGLKTAYLDNITLSQVPEPHALWLISLFLMACAVHRRRLVLSASARFEVAAAHSGKWRFRTLGRPPGHFESPQVLILLMPGGIFPRSIHFGWGCENVPPANE